MAFEVKKVKKTEVEVVLTASGADAKSIKNAIINRVRAEVEIPGFRKGKAPIDVIEKNYAQVIKEESAEEMLKQNYSKVVEEGAVVPVDYFKLQSVEEEADGSIKAFFTVEVMPEIQVGQYKGLEVEKAKIEIKEEDVTAELYKMIETNSKLKEAESGAKAENGDTVNINFEGFIDGVAFEGGKAEGYDLKLGTESFIDNFEDQIAGHTAGEEFDVNVSFPETYFKKELAAKPALFKVKLNSIKRVEKSELNDDFAKDMGFDTLQELKDSKKSEIEKRENTKIEHGFINSILEKIKAASDVEVPNALINREIENRIKEFEMQLSSQGASLDLYLKMNGLTKDKLVADLKPLAEEKIKIDLIVDEIAKLEKVEVTDAEIEEKMAEVATYYGMEIEKLKAQLKVAGNYDTFIENLKIEAISKKTIDLLVSETIEK